MLMLLTLSKKITHLIFFDQFQSKSKACTNQTRTSLQGWVLPRAGVLRESRMVHRWRVEEYNFSQWDRRIFTGRRIAEREAGCRASLGCEILICYRCNWGWGRHVRGWVGWGGSGQMLFITSQFQISWTWDRTRLCVKNIFKKNIKIFFEKIVSWCVLLVTHAA